MKKLLLIPAALVLSTGFAFADGWFGMGGGGGGPSLPATLLGQTASVTQTIGDTSGHAHAINKSFVLQAQVPIGHFSGGLALGQSATVDQSIGDTSGHGVAVNKSAVIQAQVPIGFFHP